MCHAMRAELRNRDWSDERVYRRAGIGATCSVVKPAGEAQAAKLSESNDQQILSGNLLRILRQVLQ